MGWSDEYDDGKDAGYKEGWDDAQDRIKDLEARLKEAEDVVRFYGNAESWLYCCVDFATIKNEDVEWTSNNVADPKDHYDGIDRIGGKRAREYLLKHKVGKNG